MEKKETHFFVQSQNFIISLTGVLTFSKNIISWVMMILIVQIIYG